mgnify:FL=1
MKYENDVVQDGVTYMAGEDVPDMGSIICTKFSGNIRNYEGLQKDLPKLPTYVATGSSCLMVDTGRFYKFEKTTKTWYEL